MAWWLKGKREPHFPYYSPLPDFTVDWYMLPGHPLHAGLAKRLGLGRDAIIGTQGKATFLDSATAIFNTQRDKNNRGYHIDDEHVHVFQLQVLVPVVGGEVILSKANLKPFNKAFSAASRSPAVRAVVAGRRAWTEQGQLLLEVFVTMAELKKYGLYDEDGYLIRIKLTIPDGRPFFLPDTSVSSPDILGHVAPELKITAGGLKKSLTRIQNGNGTDWTRLYPHTTIPADPAAFLRGESFVSVMDGDGPDQAVLGAWEAQGWPKRQCRR